MVLEQNQHFSKRTASGGRREWRRARGGRSLHMRRCCYMFTVPCHTQADAGERPCVPSAAHSLLPVA